MEEFEDPYARPLDGCFAIVFVMLCIAILAVVIFATYVLLGGRI